MGCSWALNKRFHRSISPSSSDFILAQPQDLIPEEEQSYSSWDCSEILWERWCKCPRPSARLGPPGCVIPWRLGTAAKHLKKRRNYVRSADPASSRQIYPQVSAHLRGWVMLWNADVARWISAGVKSYPRAQIASCSCDPPLHFLPADSQGKQEGIALPDLLYLWSWKFHHVTLKSVTCLTKIASDRHLAGLEDIKRWKMHHHPSLAVSPVISLLLIWVFSLITAMPTGLMKLSMQQQYGLSFVSLGFYSLS